MSEKNYSWIKIAHSIDDIIFEQNNLVEINVAGKQICLVRNNDSIFACAHKCPHAGGKMADGFMDAQGKIVCPLHRYRFDLTTGRNTSGEGYYLKTYPIKFTPEGIFIGFEKGTSWLSLFNK